MNPTKIPVILTPSTSEKPYEIASITMANLWERVTGHRPAVRSSSSELPDRGRFIVVGSDAVNPLTRTLSRLGILWKSGIRYGTDDYAIQAVDSREASYLLLSGGCGRSTLYAVYAFFRLAANARYYWDGDVLPANPDLSWDGLDILEKPRFLYRGMRYFAHRGLHRFQAEHWTLADWQSEIDYLLKSRMNLFMLRIGMDDLFQRAFPDIVPDEDVEGAGSGMDSGIGYDDRRGFLSLRQRGELRKQVLKYAFDRGLFHPEDTGTMTHWYSRTPPAFLASGRVTLAEQSSKDYNQDSGRVWDPEQESSWEHYWLLTQTHIREFGEPRIFHTIGLAERNYGSSREENLNLKKFVYRKIQDRLRRHYPDAPLLIADWDFILNWMPDEVTGLLQELDPERTLILDYLSDFEAIDAPKSFGFAKNFPWIFGLFHAFEPNTEILGGYETQAERIADALADPFCRGMVLWPELSHSDSLKLDYFARNAWKGEQTNPETVLVDFCHSRYGDAYTADEMIKIWRDVIATSLPCARGFWEKFAWDLHPHFHLFNPDSLFFPGNTDPKNFLSEWEHHFRNIPRVLVQCSARLEKILTPETYANPFWLRDSVDLLRTLLNRSILQTQIELTLHHPNQSHEPCLSLPLADRRRRLCSLLADTLEQHPDFSLSESFIKLAEHGTPPSPEFEITLKQNADNTYCRSLTYEQVRHLYPAEFEAWLECLQSDSPFSSDSFQSKGQALRREFLDRPLASMAPSAPRNVSSLRRILHKILSNDILIDRG